MPGPFCSMIVPHVGFCASVLESCCAFKMISSFLFALYLHPHRGTQQAVPNENRPSESLLPVNRPPSALIRCLSTIFSSLTLTFSSSETRKSCPDPLPANLCRVAWPVFSCPIPRYTSIRGTHSFCGFFLALGLPWIVEGTLYAPHPSHKCFFSPAYLRFPHMFPSPSWIRLGTLASGSRIPVSTLTPPLLCPPVFSSIRLG